MPEFVKAQEKCYNNQGIRKETKSARNQMCRGLSFLPVIRKKFLNHQSFGLGMQRTPNQHLPPSRRHSVNTGAYCKTQTTLSILFQFPSWEFYLQRWRGKTSHLHFQWSHWNTLKKKESARLGCSLDVWFGNKKIKIFSSPNSVEICQGTKCQQGGKLGLEALSVVKII